MVWDPFEWLQGMTGQDSASQNALILVTFDS